MPLVFISLFYRVNSIEWYLFLASIFGGLLSCFVGEFIRESDIFWNPFLSMTLILIPPSFVFFGQQLIRRGNDFKVILRYLALFSSIFSIVLVARLLLLDETVRIEIDPSMADTKLGSNLNASFF